MATLRSNIPLNLKLKEGTLNIKAGESFTLDDKYLKAIEGLITEGKIVFSDFLDCIYKGSKSEDTNQADKQSPGQLITLPPDKAEGLIRAGKVRQIGRPLDAEGNNCLKVFSEKLQAEVWVVSDVETRLKFRDQGVKEVIFTMDEVERLPDQIDALKAIHKVKQHFPGSTIEDAMKERR